MKKKTTKKKASKSHHFKAGNTLGKEGRPKDSTGLKEARKLTRAKFEEISHKYLHLPADQLHDMVDKNRGNMEHMNVIEGMIAKVLSEALKVGNIQTLSFFLERLISKARTEKYMNKVPTVQEMISETMRAAAIELSHLQQKSKSQGLNSDETRSLVQLSKVVSEMVGQSDKLAEGGTRALSDKELVAESKKALKIIAENIKGESVVKH